MDPTEYLLHPLLSSGIGALVRTFTTLKRAGGKCTFFAPSKQVIMPQHNGCNRLHNNRPTSAALYRNASRNIGMQQPSSKTRRPRRRRCGSFAHGLGGKSI